MGLARMFGRMSLCWPAQVLPSRGAERLGVVRGTSREVRDRMWVAGGLLARRVGWCCRGAATSIAAGIASMIRT